MIINPTAGQRFSIQLIIIPSIVLLPILFSSSCDILKVEGHLIHSFLSKSKPLGFVPNFPSHTET